ncbi:MAG TPA: SBBP repeat-containing protein, partial [Myxococcaceae bacterium]|nr:SBBP repeat-containing protein [Myxococcaceae bacterium]
MYFDAFVAEISEDGSALIYSTYLGGSNSDNGFAIAVDNDGNTYVTGDTFSSDFPLVNPFQTDHYDYQNAFLTKFSSDGSVLFSTYFGGGYAGTSGEAIATDAEGNVYLAGSTGSFVFPLVNPFQSSPGNGFVSKFSPDGSRLIYSSYLGGGGYNESARGIAVDGAGSAYLTGYTGSRQFPVVQPIQATYGGGMYDAFISKVSPAGDQLEFSTFFGGSGDEAVWSIFNPRCCSIAVDARGSIYATGTTTSTSLPMVNPFQAKHHGWWDVFIVRLDP